MKRFGLLAFLGLLTCSLTAQNKFITDSLDQYITRGLREWKIPGLAVAVIKDGKVVVMKGYGERDIETHEKVDENTLFMIASNTKLFTGTALAQLEYDKKLSLNDKVTKYFPSFQLYDKTSTELVTIRDMLSHHLGTKTFQGDFTFWNSKLGRREIMDRMRYLKPPGQFRQDFGYCNSCFLTAGEIIPAVTGKPWEVYVYDSIIQPLGMTNTHTLSTGMSQRPNAAHPYTTAFTGSVKAIPYDQVDNLGPAGSMVSNVKDLSKWLQVQLDSGRRNGRQVLPWAVLNRTRTVGTILSSRKSSVYPMHFQGYGMGVFVADYNGRQIYWHTGGAFGFVTNTCFVPEENLGIVILTNNDNQSFFEMLRYQLLDSYLGMPYVNRDQPALARQQAADDKVLKDIAGWRARVKGSRPQLPLSAFSGDYNNELYGSITVKPSGNNLQIKFNSHRQLTAELEYMDNGEWLMTYNNIAFGIFPVKFVTNGNRVSSVDIRANDFVEEDAYTFVKK
jgi:CubicO group peptidase (beta-lactamase class C family)